jgi:hypothetical protein
MKTYRSSHLQLVEQLEQSRLPLGKPARDSALAEKSLFDKKIGAAYYDADSSSGRILPTHRGLRRDG